MNVNGAICLVYVRNHTISCPKFSTCMECAVLSYWTSSCTFEKLRYASVKDMFHDIFNKNKYQVFFHNVSFDTNFKRHEMWNRKYGLSIRCHRNVANMIAMVIPDLTDSFYRIARVVGHPFPYFFFVCRTCCCLSGFSTASSLIKICDISLFSIVVFDPRARRTYVYDWIEILSSQCFHRHPLHCGFASYKCHATVVHPIY